MGSQPLLPQPQPARNSISSTIFLHHTWASGFEPLQPECLVLQQVTHAWLWRLGEERHPEGKRRDPGSAEVGEWEVNTVIKTSMCVSSFTEQRARVPPVTQGWVHCSKENQGLPGSSREGKPLGRGASNPGCEGHLHRTLAGSQSQWLSKAFVKSSPLWGWGWSPLRPGLAPRLNRNLKPGTASGGCRGPWTSKGIVGWLSGPPQVRRRWRDQAWGWAKSEMRSRKPSRQFEILSGLCLGCQKCQSHRGGSTDPPVVLTIPEISGPESGSQERMSDGKAASGVGKRALVPLLLPWEESAWVTQTQRGIWDDIHEEGGFWASKKCQMVPTGRRLLSHLLCFLCSAPSFPLVHVGCCMQIGFPKAPPNLPAAVKRREEDKERGYMLWAVGRWPFPWPAPWGDHRGLVRFDWSVMVHSSRMNSKGEQCRDPSQPVHSIYQAWWLACKKIPHP